MFGKYFWKSYYLNMEKKIKNFQCENNGELAPYYYGTDKSCYEHFTHGPCERIGELYLPGGKCGCHIKLPHYHEESDRCYEIGKSFFLNQ